ncbi:hypothetical protein MUN76_01305 [Leucobacter rhizosphaerae]|uniref:Tetratricopeptide repeat protein n=1 Tax=Leucobacter rhizosphaerae TaxID=2932245 RepID=A0ABY4FWH8_9MICO|nr:hypothetical protein [Leucobacter rhizosphaerae]UOQ60651.1 hypothetical protein MUN76_01305 [Leucobacter rhizosphaerae]
MENHHLDTLVVRTEPVRVTKNLKQVVGDHLEQWGSGFILRRLDTLKGTNQPVELVSSTDPDEAIVLGQLPEWFAQYLPLGALGRFACPITATCNVQGHLYVVDGRLNGFLVFEPHWTRVEELGDQSALESLADRCEGVFPSDHSDLTEQGHLRISGTLEHKLKSLGVHRGVHYLDTVYVIQNLKRERRYEEALEIALVATEASFVQSDRDPSASSYPPPFYAKHAGIILRKLGRMEESKLLAKRYENALTQSTRKRDTVG